MDEINADLRIGGIVKTIYRNMGHASFAAWDAFWRAQNEKTGRPIPEGEIARRRALIAKAAAGWKITVEEQEVPE